MGQYFTFINIDKKLFADDSGHKLTEECWLGNSLTEAIKLKIRNEWKGDRVVLLGDYADGDSYSRHSSSHAEFLEALKNDEQVNCLTSERLYYWVRNQSSGFKPAFTSGDRDANLNRCRYLYNTARKEYVDSFKVFPSYVNICDNQIYFEKLDAYSLLVAMGNGEGGGDYFGPSDDMVGLWATTSDCVIISDKAPNKSGIDGVDTFLELTPLFCEAGDAYNRPVLNEQLILQDFFEFSNVDENTTVDVSNLCSPKQVEMMLEDFKKKMKLR